MTEALRTDSGGGRYVFTGTDGTLLRKTGRKIPGAAYTSAPLSPPFYVNLVLSQRFVQSSVMVRPGGPLNTRRLAASAGRGPAWQKR